MFQIVSTIWRVGRETGADRIQPNPSVTPHRGEAGVAGVSAESGAGGAVHQVHQT